MRFSIQKRLLILLLLIDIVEWVLFTLSTICFEKINMSETWRCRTRTMFSSNLPLYDAFNALSAQLGLGSELVDWYRHATSVPYVHLLNDMSSRTDGWRRYCTNTGPNRPKFYILDQQEQANFLDEEHTNYLYSPRVPILFPLRQNSFVSVLSKIIYQVPMRKYRKPY